MAKDFFVSDEESIITLLTASGEEVDFIEVAEIAHEGKQYAILQPVELLDGMDDDEALVFEVELDDDGRPTGFNVVLDDELIDKIFEIYNDMWAECDSRDN